MPGEMILAYRHVTNAWAIRGAYIVGRKVKACVGFVLGAMLCFSVSILLRLPAARALTGSVRKTVPRSRSYLPYPHQFFNYKAQHFAVAFVGARCLVVRGLFLEATSLVFRRRVHVHDF